jgi:hypothetical protein
MDIPNTCECLYYLESTLPLLPTCSFRLVASNFSSQKTQNFLHVNQFICYDVVFALIIFTYLPEIQIYNFFLFIQTNSFIIFTRPNLVLPVPGLMALG